MDDKHWRFGPLGQFGADAMLEKLDEQVLIMTDKGKQIGLHVRGEFSDGFGNLHVLQILEFIADPIQVFLHAVLKTVRRRFFVFKDMQYDEFRHEEPDDIGESLEVFLIGAFFHLGCQDDPLRVPELNRFRNDQERHFHLPDDAARGPAGEHFTEYAASLGPHDDQVRIPLFAYKVQNGILT